MARPKSEGPEAVKVHGYLTGETADKWRAYLDALPEPRATESAIVAFLIGEGLAKVTDKPRERRKAG